MHGNEDDAPDLSTPEWEERIAATPVSRGRPRIPNPKRPITIRLDQKVVVSFKTAGPGCQPHLNEAPQTAAGLK